MAACKSCGADLLWVYTEGGKPMPLSLASMEKRFTVREIAPAHLLGTVEATYLSHFADCPNADEHRKG